MRDQAENLRVLMKAKLTDRGSTAEENMRILTITSGKGGVGKTSLAVNLAIALQDMGYRVLIIDADFGLGNVDIMLGLSTKYNLSHVIFDGIDIYDVIVRGPSGIMILPGGSGLLNVADLEPSELDRFLKQLTKVHNIADIMLIDTGAGLSSKNIKMILAANEAILVTTPDPTSLMDAYGMVKVVSSVGNNINFKLVMNMVEDVNDARIAIKNFQKAGKKFLDVEITKLGLIERNSAISRSVRAQSPFILQNPHNKAARQLRDIASSLVGDDYREDDMCIRSYVTRLFELLKKK